MFSGYGLAVSLKFISCFASVSDFAAWTEESIRQLREQHDLPFVRADAEGMVVEINQRFREVYGWSDEQLIGQSLGLILPQFSRLAPRRLCSLSAHGGLKVLNHPLTLATFCSDGRAIESEHYIVMKRQRRWLVFCGNLASVTGTG